MKVDACDPDRSRRWKEYRSFRDVGGQSKASKGQSTVLKVLERLEHDIRRLGLPSNKQWAAASALFSDILRVCGLNVANGQLARI